MFFIYTKVTFMVYNFFFYYFENHSRVYIVRKMLKEVDRDNDYTRLCLQISIFFDDGQNCWEEKYIIRFNRYLFNITNTPFMMHHSDTHSIGFIGDIQKFYVIQEYNEKDQLPLRWVSSMYLKVLSV